MRFGFVIGVCEVSHILIMLFMMIIVMLFLVLLVVLLLMKHCTAWNVVTIGVKLAVVVADIEASHVTCSACAEAAPIID